MIYYPLAVLMLAGIREILLISTPTDTPHFERLLGDGKQWGISITYKVQEAPRGIAEAFIIGEEFIGQDQVCLVLGDNIFYGKLDFLRRAIANNNINSGGTIFGYAVNNPQAYGVVEFTPEGKVLSIEEKPENPKSKYAIPGVYVFDKDVANIAKNLTPGKRGELEITDIQKEYLKRNALNVEIIGRGIAWLDTGTPENLLEASNFISAIEKRQGRKIACLEEIALYMRYLSREKYINTVNRLPNSPYRDYCLTVLEEVK